MTLEGERYSFGGLNMPFIPSDKWTQDLVTNQATVGPEAHEYHAHPTLDPQVFVKGLLSWWMAEHHWETPVHWEAYSPAALTPGLLSPNEMKDYDKIDKQDIGAGGIKC